MSATLTNEEAAGALRDGITAATRSGHGPNGTHHRTLPHSIEAEEALISACILDGDVTVTKCQESGVDPESFYETSHQIIFERLTAMRASRKPIDASTVAEELKASGYLDQAGGYSAIMRVSSLAATTANAGFFIERVRELALIRKIIRSATGAVEDCYGFKGDLSSFLADVGGRIIPLVSADAAFAASAITAWECRRAGVGRAVRKEEPCLRLGKVVVANKSNIGLVTALRKSGKTAVVGGMLGAIIGGPNARGDTLGFSANNEHEHAVLHFDTEQSPKDHEYLIATILRRAGVATIPPWFYSWGVKGVPAVEQRQRLQRLLRETNRRHKGVHSVFLDGVGDLVTDTNDPKECNPFVTELEAISSDYNCSVQCLLHLNPPKRGESTKGRGHLGSQLERKCETELRINADDSGVATIYTECARHSPIREKDGPRFSWDHDAAMHLTSASTVSCKDEAKKEKASNTLDAVFIHAGKDALNFTDFLRSISAVTGVQASAAEDRFYQIKKFGLIQKNLLGQWCKLTPS